MKNKSYQTKKTTHWDIVTCPLLKPFKQRFINVTSFRLSKLLYSQSIPFKHSNNFGCALPNHLDCRICDIKFLTQVRFLFSIFYFLYHFNFSFDTQNLPCISGCSYVITLPVSC